MCMKRLSHMKDYIAGVIFIVVNMNLDGEEPIHQAMRFGRRLCLAISVPPCSNSGFLSPPNGDPQ